jgi:Tat protein translocase TatB subunit
MFDIGFWELIILFGLGLVILGPERLPKVAMQLGNWAGQARRMARSLTSQIREPGMDDLKPKSPPDTASADADPENSIYKEPDTRSHADAAEDAADSADSKPT